MKAMNRRTFLRGTGVTIGLPLMEAMIPARAEASTTKTRRLVWIYLPNGYAPAETDINNPQNYSIPTAIQNATSAIRGDTSVIRGLSVFNPPKWDSASGNQILSPSLLTGDAHSDVFPTYLTGGLFGDRASVMPKTWDQWIADVNLGSKRRSISAVLRYTSEDRYTSYGTGTAANSNHNHTMSYQGPDRPVPFMANPKALFDQLFTGITGPSTDTITIQQAINRRGLLSHVMDDIRKVTARLGREDRVRLDEYLTGLNELDLKLRALSETSTGPTCSAPDLMTATDSDSSFPQRMRMFYDLILFAFKCDLTRVASVMHAREGTRMRHPFVSGLNTPSDWHTMSHLIRDPNDPEYRQLSDDPNANWQDMVNVVAWHHRQIADFVLRLKAEKLPTGQSLLDECAVVWGSGFSKGMHDPRGLFVNIAGTANGALRPGQNINANNGTVANLWLTLMQAFGSPQSRYGNSSGIYSSLRA
jgi:hypothetical protein